MRNAPVYKQKLLEKLKKTPIVEVACKQAGLPRSTYYRWRKEDPDFALACEEAIDESAGLINDMAESQLIAAIKERNMSAITFWLKHHHRAYETRVKVGGDVRIHSQELTPDQEALVAKALKMVGVLEDDNNEE